MAFLRTSCCFLSAGRWRLIKRNPAPWCCQEAAKEYRPGFSSPGTVAGCWQQAGAGFRPICFARTIGNDHRHWPSPRSRSQPDFGMKARASNLMIGTRTLAVIAVAFVGLLGARKFHSIQQRGPLRIVFEGSASGLHNGGSVNFDGVQVGEILSLKLDNPRKVVAFVMLDNSAPIRRDTVVGLEFQGLTGVAAISLTGGAAAAPPVPLDADGVPTLTADLSEITSIRDTLHNVDRVLVGNQAMLKDAMLSFETYTAMLAAKGDAIDGIMRKADSAFESIDSGIAKIDDVLPGFASGSGNELFEKVKS